MSGAWDEPIIPQAHFDILFSMWEHQKVPSKRKRKATARARMARLQAKATAQHEHELRRIDGAKDRLGIIRNPPRVVMCGFSIDPSEI